MNDGLISEYSETITEEGLRNSSAKLYPKGTLVLALYGATVGKVGIVNFDTVSNQAVCAVFPTEEVDKRYLFWFLRQKRLDFLRMSFGGAQPNISQAVVRNTSLPVPPLGIQKQVVAILDEYELSKNLLETEALTEIRDDLYTYNIIKTGYDKIVENNSTNSELYQKLRQSILREAISGKLVPQDPKDEPASELLKKIKAEKERLIIEKKIKRERSLSSIEAGEIPYDLPKGWAWVRLGDLIKISSGEGLTSAQMHKEGDIPVFGGNGINGYHDKQNVNKKTIVIGRVGFYCGSIHVTPEKAWVTDNAFITTFPEGNIDIDFLTWLLKGTNLKEEENATAQPVISGRKVYPIIVGLPPLSEQKRIVEKVDQLMKLCDELEEKVKGNQNNSELLMEAVLKEAFAS